MPKCTDGSVEFGRVGRRVVEASFDGGDIVSDGGVLLLQRVDERLGLSRAAAFGDDRRGASVQHSVRSMLAQRIYGLCLGWADVCDHNTLRNDLVLQTAVGRAESLASGPTLSRLETSATPAHAAALHGVLMQQFIAAHPKPPKELVLDVDATHVPLHGDQERGHFHAYYDNYCYLPLYVFAGQHMLACVLHPSDRDPASVVNALIKQLLVPLRRAWPKTKIIVRADWVSSLRQWCAAAGYRGKLGDSAAPQSVYPASVFRSREIACAFASLRFAVTRKGMPNAACSPAACFSTNGRRWLSGMTDTMPWQRIAKRRLFSFSQSMRALSSSWWRWAGSSPLMMTSTNALACRINVSRSSIMRSPSPETKLGPWMHTTGNWPASMTASEGFAIG
jgi:Transposase DDE domain group 1